MMEYYDPNYVAEESANLVYGGEPEPEKCALCGQAVKYGEDYCKSCEDTLSRGLAALQSDLEIGHKELLEMIFDLYE